MSDWYIYSVAVEAFFLRAMGSRLDAAARARIAEVGIELDRPLLAAYPADVFHRAVALAAEAVRPDLPPDEAHYLAGRDHLQGFVESYSGRMMLAVARKLEPRTILEYTATFIRLGNNFTETTARVTGVNRLDLWINEVGGVPGWYRGIFARGLELAGVPEVAVEHLEGRQAATYRMTWGGGGLSPGPAAG